MNQSITKNLPAITTLIGGAEIWSSCAGVLVRQSAVPSLGEIDRRLGKPRAALADRIVQSAQEQSGPVVAHEQGVTALAWPVLDRGEVTAIVVLYLSSPTDEPSAIELWTGRAGRSELCLKDAHYNGLERFSRLSRYIAFPKGAGLPGMAWESGLPQLIDGLGVSEHFMRSSGAATEGLDVGLSLPLIDGTTIKTVALLMSGAGLPLAQGYEVWQPATRGDSLRLVMTQGVYQDSDPSVARHRVGMDIPAGDGWIGRAWASRLPEVVYSADGSALHRPDMAESGVTAGLALPIISLDDVRSLLVLMW